MNAAALAAEASFHNAQDLKSSIFHYIACNLEAMMENGLLDDMDIRILNDLTDFVRDRQAEKLPLTRSGILLDMAMERHRDWMVLQDFPEPRLRYPRDIKPKSPRLTSTQAPTPFSKSKGKAKGTFSDTRTSPHLAGSKTFNEELDMDDLMLPDAAPPLSVPSQPSSDALDSAGAKNSAWRSQAVEAKRYECHTKMIRIVADHCSSHVASICGASWRRRKLSSRQLEGLHLPRAFLLQFQVDKLVSVRLLAQSAHTLRRRLSIAVQRGARHPLQIIRGVHRGL